ncbi:MAG: TonB-dependent receptor [Chlorobium sp.]
MNKKVFLVVTAGLLCSKGLLAEVQPRSFLGEEMVVTATKTLNSIRNAGGSSVTVITAEEIKNSGQNTVEEVIKGTAGIDVVQNGGPGTLATVFLRGADPKNTLLLVDGIPSNDPADGQRAPNFSNLTVDNIDRIEIVRGPVSFLYGSNASAGVINIITKKGGTIPAVFFALEGGAYGTFKYCGGANGQKGPLDYSLGVSRLQTDGFSATDEKNRWVNPTGKSFEKDGYENTTLSGKFGLNLNKNITLDTVLRYTKANAAYDNPGVDVPGNTQDYDQFSSRVALSMNYKPLVSTLYYTVNNQDRTYYGTNSGIYNGHQYDIGWQGDFAVAENNTVSVGLNNQHESMRNGPTFDRNMASNSVFLQDQWHVGVFNLVGGLRYEDNEKFGSKRTYRFAPSCDIGKSVLKFSYGTGFRAPSLFELYSPVYGNQQLLAETSAGWDAGIEQKLSERVKLGATYFRMDYDNRIAYDFGTLKYAQVAGITKTLGIESFAEWKPVDQLFFACNYTCTFTEDASGNRLLRRPKNKVGLTGMYKISKNGRVSTNMQWVGTRKDTGAKNTAGIITNDLPDYFLVNMSCSYQLTPSLELYGRVDNLFDTWYEEAWRYATPGRSAYAGVKVTF